MGEGNFRDVISQMRAESAMERRLGVINEEGHHIRWIRQRPPLFSQESVSVGCGITKKEPMETDAATLMKLEIFNERMHD